MPRYRPRGGNAAAARGARSARRVRRTLLSLLRGHRSVLAGLAGWLVGGQNGSLHHRPWIRNLHARRTPHGALLHGAQHTDVRLARLGAAGHGRAVSPSSGVDLGPRSPLWSQELPATGREAGSTACGSGRGGGARWAVANVLAALSACYAGF